MNRVRNGELYRVICDTKGAFVQPAIYEAFGLTVVEAMTCGLPTFATCNGGPAEIIVHGKSGFHIDPYHGDRAAEILVEFFEKSKADPPTPTTHPRRRKQISTPTTMLNHNPYQHDEAQIEFRVRDFI